MLTLPPAPIAQPAPGFGVFMSLLGGVIGRLVSTGAHADVTVIIKDGKPALVRITQTCLPGQLPKL